VCLTHDVDRIRATYQNAAAELRKDRFKGALVSAWTDLTSARRENAYWNFERIVQFERDLDIRSALYVLFEKRRWLRACTRGEPQHVLGVYDPNDIAEELREMRNDGFEIGLHASLDADTGRYALSAELEKLARLLNTDDTCCGVRNHYLVYGLDTSPKNQSEAGVLYDSSMGFNYTCGFRCGTVFPFPLLVSGRILWELPFMIMDTAVRECAGGREPEMLDQVAGVVRDNEGLLTINWHQRLCNPDLLPWMWDWTAWMIDRAKEDGAWIAKPHDIVLHLNARGQNEP